MLFKIFYKSCPCKHEWTSESYFSLKICEINSLKKISLPSFKKFKNFAFPVSQIKILLAVLHKKCYDLIFLYIDTSYFRYFDKQLNAIHLLYEFVEQK